MGALGPPRMLSPAFGCAGSRCVRATTHIPRGARRVGGASTLRVADCTLVLRGDAALVTRGENRLVIPAVSRFYVAGNRLVLDRTDGAHDDVRVYVLAGGAVPRFVPEPARKP